MPVRCVPALASSPAKVLGNFGRIGGGRHPEAQVPGRRTLFEVTVRDAFHTKRGSSTARAGHSFQNAKRMGSKHPAHCAQNDGWAGLVLPDGHHHAKHVRRA